MQNKFAVFRPPWSAVTKLVIGKILNSLIAIISINFTFLFIFSQAISNILYTYDLLLIFYFCRCSFPFFLFLSLCVKENLPVRPTLRGNPSCCQIYHFGLEYFMAQLQAQAITQLSLEDFRAHLQAQAIARPRRFHGSAVGLGYNQARPSPVGLKSKWTNKQSKFVLCRLIPQINDIL